MERHTIMSGYDTLIFEYYYDVELWCKYYDIKVQIYDTTMSLDASVISTHGTIVRSTLTEDFHIKGEFSH